MPCRNVIKINVPESYYHVYARGASKQPIFLEHADYMYFISLFKRYLSKKVQTNKSGAPYPHLHESIELLTFCLMKNHFHLLVYQKQPDTMAKLLKSIMSSYGRYFNLKYHRSGSLYESTYKASRIDADNYLLHISRYIHLNPRYWLSYNYSSISYYISSNTAEWINTKRILDMFSSINEYINFLEDYNDQKAILEELKHELAAV